MLRPATLLVALATVLTVSAQSSSANFTSCCDIQPSSVDTNTRISWCRAQSNTCPLLCQNGQTKSNNCTQETLTYDCQCLSGTTPNISDYGQTLASLECEEWVKQCTAAHPNDLNGQTFCQSFICGKKNASAIGAGASTSASSTGSATGSATGSGGSATGSASSTGGTTSSSSAAAAAALGLGSEYGTAGVVMGLLALFGMAL